jgi:guanylate kinase
MTKMHLLGNLKKGLIFILSAPAGTGKTTLVRMLVDEFSCVSQSISYTTRLPRSGEQEGVHYHFLNVVEFEKKIAENEFLEYVRLYNDYYGTSRHWVEQQQAQGKHVILVIDTQGALQLKKKTAATYIFVKPPSFMELERRLRMRKTESQELIEQRLVWAKHELAAERYYDYTIVNDDLNTAYQVLRSIVVAEEHRVER